MQVEPNALDSVRIRTIGRKEVENDAAIKLCDTPLRDAAAVDDVVVEDDVDAPSRAMLPGAPPKELAEQIAVLAVAGDPGELPRGGVQCAGDVALLVLARRDHLPLKA